MKNARGYTTAYEYDSCGNVAKTTDAMGGNTTNVYDGNGNLLSVTDALGNTTSYTYDKLGRVTKTETPAGVTLAEYDANGNITKVTQADGHVITYAYDALNRLTSYVDTEGYVHSYTYDANGNVITETDGNGYTTVYTYDKLNRVISAKDGDGGVSKTEYDADGRVIQITDALGNKTTFTYDAMDRVVTTTDAKGGVTAYTYTNRGEIATKTDAEGYVTSYEYDGNGNCVKMTTVDGVTVYTYDALDRLTGTVTPDNEEETFTYDAMGNITSSTDKNGNTTQYIYDDSYNLVETIDALGTSAHFEYDAMGNLTKTTLHRVDAQDKVDELEVTVYEYDGRGLTTKKIDALGNVTVYEYDGNGNLAAETDADGCKTEYTYNALDLVTSINYNGVKDVKYVYNAAGNLVQMTDWLGTTTFEVDLLHQLKSVTDHKGNVVTYDYDSVGNQTAIHYPDGTTAAYDYDLVKNQTKATECDGSETTYTYDGMGRVTEMRYPNGWVEYYTYDSMGRLLAVNDTHPSEKPAKTQKHTYRYDANGNMTYEYMRGNGTGQAKNETLYTYDALNRLITAHDNYGNSTRVYTYDSLGNLTYETGAGSHNMDYTYNNLNQLITQSDDGWKTYTASSYDNRGNLVLEEYHKNKKTVNTVGQYFYDETNKMVRGINAAGEESLYSYNGLGALVENTWKIAQNGYGYHGVNADTSDNESHNGQGNGNSSGNSHGNNGNGNVKKTSTVIKQFVPDYTTETYQPLTEHEVNGLDYRYVYSDKARLSVVVQGIENGSASVLDDKGELHAYYHCDYLGTTDYLTSAVNSKVISWTSYNEWGEITHNAVLKCGQRELDLVKLYATHDYDAVLNQFYAKARFYDADNRRFTAVDPILDPAQYDLKAYANDPMQLVQYLYVKDNAVNWIDITGKIPVEKFQVLLDSYKRGNISKMVKDLHNYNFQRKSPLHILAQVITAGEIMKSAPKRGTTLLGVAFEVPIRDKQGTLRRIDVMAQTRGKNGSAVTYAFEVKKHNLAGRGSTELKTIYFPALTCNGFNVDMNYAAIFNKNQVLFNRDILNLPGYAIHFKVWHKADGLILYKATFRGGTRSGQEVFNEAFFDISNRWYWCASLADSEFARVADNYAYLMTGKHLAQMTPDEAAVLGMETSAGILISGAGFAGGYAAAIGSKATSVVRTIVVKGGKQVKLIFKSTGASAAEIAKWTNHFGNIMKPVTSMA